MPGIVINLKWSQIIRNFAPNWGKEVDENHKLFGGWSLGGPLLYQSGKLISTLVLILFIFCHSLVEV
ncbi:hypothetical protein L3Q72_09615 [Vibrio sp. JC009]|uniref:hypothetical protein n=1 Tax=Vibrio sp. JC009 TaxID=2912314 RepID=UPI0023AF076B|nr:hypothetical protein [Vibrio sp. JC009]WED20899.1 hypothetical protein L3Q72_09615 [Vibrio sp. JC009]